MKNSYPAALILIVMSLLLPKTAFASCAAKPSVEDEAKGASIIFIGTVTKITPAEIASASYSILAKKPTWQMEMKKVDLVTFSVSEAFKGVSSDKIEIATDANGFAGYSFEGGTWLRTGQTYLVYAYKRLPAGTIPDDLTEENYGPVTAELRAIYKAFPKQLAAQINEFNSKISPYAASVCGRTESISNAAAELMRIRKMFPRAKRFNNRATARQLIQPERNQMGFHAGDWMPGSASAAALIQALD